MNVKSHFDNSTFTIHYRRGRPCRGLCWWRECRSSGATAALLRIRGPHLFLRSRRWGVGASSSGSCRPLWFRRRGGWSRGAEARETTSQPILCKADPQVYIFGFHRIVCLIGVGFVSLPCPRENYWAVRTRRTDRP